MKFHVALACLYLAASTGCSKPEMAVRNLCTGGKPRNFAPNGFSLVFKAEYIDEVDDGRRVFEPITDLQELQGEVKLVVDDGGNTTGKESQPSLIQRPQNVALKTLILIDGSGSIYDEQSNTENKIKDAVRQFLQNIDDARHIIGIYKFYGDRTKIEPIHGFSPERLQRLDPNYYASADEWKAEWLKDRDAMLKSMEPTSTPTIARAGTSTALHDALRISLDTIQNLGKGTPAPGGPLPSVLVKTLIVFTDGKDEVAAGSDYISTKETAIVSAGAFKSNTNNTVLIAGVAKEDDDLDNDLLEQVASPNGLFLSEKFDLLGDAFRRFAEKAAAKANKYYQFSMCSNRRGQAKIGAILRINHPQYQEGQMSFIYDASQFVDPTSETPCNLNAAQACEWSDASGS